MPLPAVVRSISTYISLSLPPRAPTLLLLLIPQQVTTDLRLNEPRYATLPNIMKARKKKIASLNLVDLGIDTTPRLNILSVEEPAQREAGVVLESVDELAEKINSK